MHLKSQSSMCKIRRQHDSETIYGSCSKPPADVFPFQIFQAFRPLLGWKLKPSIPKHAAAVDLSTAHVTLFWSLPHQSWAADSEPLDHREFAPPTIGPALRHTLRCSGWGCVHLSSRNTWKIEGKLILCLHTLLESAGKLVAVKLKQTQAAQLRRRCHWRGEARDVQAGAMPCYKLLQRMRSVEWNQEEHTKERHKMKCCHARYVRVGHATSCTDSQNNMKQLCSKYTFLVFRMSHQVPSARRISYWSKALNWFPSTFWKGWTAHSSSFAKTGMKCFQPLFGVNSRPTWSRIKAGTGRWSCISLYQINKMYRSCYSLSNSTPSVLLRVVGNQSLSECRNQKMFICAHPSNHKERWKTGEMILIHAPC